MSDNPRPSGGSSGVAPMAPISAEPPKPGDKLVRVCESALGRPVSRKIVTITRLTPAGFIYVAEDRDSKYRLGAAGKWHEHRPRLGPSMQFRIWLERPPK